LVIAPADSQRWTPHRERHIEFEKPLRTRAASPVTLRIVVVETKKSCTEAGTVYNFDTIDVDGKPEV
jgi:hypothetical protein